MPESNRERGDGETKDEAAMDDQIRLVFLGNSITAGYGVDTDQAFPALIQHEIDRAGLPVAVVNAGFSGDTSSGGLSRIDWLLQRRIDVLVVELGGNDGLRGIDLSLTESNLAGIIDRTLERYPDCRIVVAGMMVPPNLGHEYTEDFRKIFPALAERFDAELIPFILEGVGGVRALNQPDGIHPTPEGHRIVAHTVWAHLESILRELTRSDPAGTN